VIDDATNATVTVATGIGPCAIAVNTVTDKEAAHIVAYRPLVGARAQ